MGSNPSTNASPALSNDRNRNHQQNSVTESKWPPKFSSSNAEQVKSYSRRVTEDVYDHMDPPGPKKLSTSPDIDIHEIIHQGATRMFQGIPTETADTAERPYNQHHTPTLLEEKEQRARNQKNK